MDVVDRLKRITKTECREHTARIGQISIGEDQLAPRQPRDTANHPGVMDDVGHINVVDKIEKLVRINIMMFHQAAQRGAVVVKEILLHTPRLDRIDSEQSRDIVTHALINLGKQIDARVIKGIVEIENPGADAGEVKHHNPARIAGVHLASTHRLVVRVSVAEGEHVNAKGTWRRAGVFGPVAGLASLMLAACGGGGSSVASIPAAPIVVAPTPAPTPTPTPTPVVTFNTLEDSRSTGAVQMQAVAAYQRGATGAGITIGITDSGVDVDSAEFTGRISPASLDLVSGRPIDDQSGHGTSVAAVALAARDDVNFHGVAFGATLLALRTDTVGSCSGTDGCTHADSVLARAVDHAVLNGARIINMSLGGSPANQTLRNAIGRATRAGIIIVISAGNDGAAEPDALALVANDALTANGLVIIAGSIGTASDQQAISTFSNKAGSGAAHYVAASGYRVRSFDHAGTGFLFSGTSYSAPHISGALALILQAFPNLTPTQAVGILFSSADDAGTAGVDTVFGQGIVNLARAFQPIGGTSLAGSAIAISTISNAVLGGAFGDSAQLGSSLSGAVILDSYGRAFETAFGDTIRAAPTSTLLASRLADRSGNVNFGRGATILNLSIAPTAQPRPWLGLAQGGRDARAGEGHRVASGFATTRTDAHTRTGMSYGYAANVLAGVLAGTSSPAYLTSGALGETGLLQRNGVAGAVLRDVGTWQIGLSASNAQVAAQRSALRLAPQHDGSVATVTVSASRSFGPVALTGGVSQVTESGTVLGTDGSSALGLAGASSTFATLEIRADIAGWNVSVGARNGWTAARLATGLVRDIGTIRTTAWEGEVSRARLLGNDRLSARIAQPLRVYDGIASLMVPVSYDYATSLTGFEHRSANLAPSGREIDFEAVYSVALAGGSLDANVYLRRDPGNVSTRADDLGAAIRYAIAF